MAPGGQGDEPGGVSSTGGRVSEPSVARLSSTTPPASNTCTAYGLRWATTTVNPALPIVGLLLTPQLRTAALCIEAPNAQGRDAP